MKKNYSQKVFKQPAVIAIIPTNQSPEKFRTDDSPIKKVFQRKPQQGHTPFSRKRVDQVASQVDSTMEQTNSSGIIDKLKNFRFISYRSQKSLTNSIVSRSSGSHSFVNFFTDSIDEGQQCSRILPDESIIYQSPQRQSGGRELFRRKTANPARTPAMNQRMFDQNSGKSSSIIGKFRRKMDKAQQQTKPESSNISDHRQSLYMPSLMKVKNMAHNSKHSSKQSMRKSSSSNSIRINGPTINCQECDYNLRQLTQVITKNQELERLIKEKDDQIINLNNRIQEIEQRNWQLQKKMKDSQRSELSQRIKHLELQLNDSQDECLMLKNAYNEALQQLKYKTVQNTTMKKYQAQCESVERKMQLLITERDELRQRLSSKNISSRSSYTNYPSSLSRQAKSNKINNVQNLAVPHNSLKTFSDNNRQTYTSRNEGQTQQFYGEQYQHERISALKRNGPNKKRPQNKSYEETSQSEIISLSEESTF